MNPYFAFWTNGYGQTPKREEFKDQKKLLEFITKASLRGMGALDFRSIELLRAWLAPRPAGRLH